MPQAAEKTPELDVFAGAEPDPVASEEVTGDRGDSVEPVAVTETPATPVVDQQEPVGEPQAPPETAESPESSPPEPEKPAAEPETAEPRIPKSRFDQVNERRKLAEQRLRELEAEIEASKRVQQPGTEFNFDDAEQKYMEAVVDGEFDKAKQIRTQIRNAEREALASQALRLRDQATEGARQNLALDAEVSALQAQFPIFDAESEVFDEVITAEALDIFNGLVATGKYTPVAAVRKAAEMVTKANGIAPRSAEPEAPKPPARDTKPDLSKKIEAANKQPPTKVVGSKGESKHNVLDMSEDEFASLPDSTLRKLRGVLL